MKKHLKLFLMLLIMPIVILGGCSNNENKNGDNKDKKNDILFIAPDYDYQFDYYGEYKFVLPFETYLRHYVGDVLFRTDLTMEQMCESIISAGHGAEIFEFDGWQRLLISKQLESGRLAYLVIFPRDNHYVLSATNTGSMNFNFPAPLHLMRNDKMGFVQSESASPYDWCKIAIHGTFDDVADFYEKGAKNVVVNRDNFSITFTGRTNSFPGWPYLPVTVEYLVDDDGAWLNYSTVLPEY